MEDALHCSINAVNPQIRCHRIAGAGRNEPEQFFLAAVGFHSPSDHFRKRSIATNDGKGVGCLHLKRTGNLDQMPTVCRKIRLNLATCFFEQCLCLLSSLPSFFVARIGVNKHVKSFGAFSLLCLF